MSVPSQHTASQIEFQDAMANLNVQSNAPSGCDTPIPINRISDETLDTLNSVSHCLGRLPTEDNPRKRKKRSPSPGDYPNRDRYPVEAKPIYLRLKNLHKKKLAIASNIKTLESKLQKNVYPTAVDFRFNINRTRNPKLKEVWSSSIRRCKTEMTQALISDLQTGYNTVKSDIAKQWIELEIHLEADQLREIKDSLSTRFKQMAPAFLEKKERQYERPQPKKTNFKRNNTPEGQIRNPANLKINRNDPKVNRLINTLRDILK